MRMDEISNISKSQFDIPLDILDKNHVIRNVHENELDKIDKKVPKASHFSFRNDEKDLSVNCEAIFSADKICKLIGLTHKKNGEFKNIHDFKLFRFPVGFLRNLEGVNKVLHTPIFNGDPSPVGSPNNFSHSSIYLENDEEIRLKISDYCRKNLTESLCVIDYEHLSKEIIKLRELENKTEFHCCMRED